MKVKYLIAASAAALFVAGSAHAADVVQSYPEPTPVVAAEPAFSWTGFYIGGQIGGAWGDTDVKTRKGAYNTSNALGSRHWSPDPSGFIGGLYAGYNFEVGNNVVLGLETDFAWSDMSEGKTSHAYTYGTAGEVLGDDVAHARLKQKWAGATRVRVGYAIDRWLPYIAGGVAYAKVDSSVKGYLADAAGLPVAGSAYGVSGSDTFTGWTLGAGVDYAMTDNLIVRLEYRYSDFGNKSFGTGDYKFKTDYKTNDFRVGVAYKF